ncbi:hypothetical protein TraAM80_06627 [Trypanosoma rangeli]|uniref:Glycosomal membrane protein n=1 Tax=Trypanosoma rangeli TaxID=5698 RepID=A0A422N9F2_TRYRA|nr:uncharacterized protein TraAM80_06627 [Trypanosoma rangeli]RNF02090.1 hypothetical protein TraAM80_06627 [Trypanosoma rangeli]|eukprot:RNF02090.1 hypothetical protein TraAM80_06627 [Trypanosoma rangeli]
MKEKGTVVPFCASVDAYVKKGAGIDLVLKSLAGLSRLVSIYSKDEETRQSYASFGSAIINCRMLANHFRHVASLNSAIVTLKQRNGRPLLSWLCLFGSFFFRSLEQVFGDLNYYQSVVMRHWDRNKLSLGYWFFKSLSLTCGFFYELLGLRANLASPEWPKKSAEGRKKILWDTLISLLRYFFDMVVYYQWMPWYNPYKTVQYASAAAAGMLGVYVVWNDTQATRLAEVKKASLMSGAMNGKGAVENAKSNTETPAA